MQRATKALLSLEPTSNFVNDGRSVAALSVSHEDGGRVRANWITITGIHREVTVDYLLGEGQTVSHIDALKMDRNFVEQSGTPSVERFAASLVGGIEVVEFRPVIVLHALHHASKVARQQS